MSEIPSPLPISEIAKRLVDQNTGRPSTVFRTDFSQTLPRRFMEFHQACQRDLDFRGQRTQQVVFLPELALEMVKGTARLANQRGVEFGGMLYGAALPITASNVEGLAVAFPTAAMDYSQASGEVTQVFPQIAEANAEILARQTNLTSTLSALTQRAAGVQLAEFHIHHTGLSRNFWGNPSGHPGGSSGDYQRIEQLLTTGSLRNRVKPYIWGIFTLVNNQLQYTLTRSYVDHSGRVIHEQLPIIEEH